MSNTKYPNAKEGLTVSISRHERQITIGWPKGMQRATVIEEFISSVLKFYTLGMDKSKVLRDVEVTAEVTAKGCADV